MFSEIILYFNHFINLYNNIIVKLLLFLIVNIVFVLLFIIILPYFVIVSFLINVNVLFNFP